MGLGLFLFIPLVLYLYLVRPFPVLISLGSGVFLMLIHRFPARAYMFRAVSVKCLWCDGCFKPGESRVRIRVKQGNSKFHVFVHPQHEQAVRRFYACLYRGRYIFRVGIFVPLIILLGALLTRGLNIVDFVEQATLMFKGVIGIVVNIAAFGYLMFEPSEEVRPVFPPHNFHLIGVRQILWIFRIVGIWWIIQTLGAIH